MITTLIRTSLIFLMVVITVRMMGKRQIGEMQPFELVITLIIAEVSCVPMADPAIPLSYGIVPILTLFLLHFILSFISRKSIKFRSLLDGNSIVVISPDGINYKALKQLNMTINDLLEAVRNSGYFRIEDVHYAIFETNGKLCVLPKSAATNLTRADMNISAAEAEIPIPLIIDGKLLNEDRVEYEKERLLSFFSNNGVNELKPVVLLTLDGEGAMYVQERGKKFRVLHTGVKIIKPIETLA